MNLQTRNTLLEKLNGLPEFTLKVQQQLEKDLHSFGGNFSLEFTKTSLPFNQLVDEVNDCVVSLLKGNESKFLQFLYTIDLPEKEFLGLIGNSDFAEELTIKIILREAYKVHLRAEFGSGK